MLTPEDVGVNLLLPGNGNRRSPKRRLLPRLVLLLLFVFPVMASWSSSLFVSAGLTTEGLYRVSGNKTDQDNIQKLFDQGEPHLSSALRSSASPGLRS